MVREREPVLFVINPISGLGNGKNLSAKIERLLDSSRYAPVIEYTQPDSDATSIAKDYLENGVRKFFAVGGDGTVNQVARAIINTEAILGIVPIGSGNGFARHLRIPMDVSHAIRLVYREKIAMVDYGLINQNPFFCTAGIGFDANVCYRFEQLAKRGILSYIKATLREFPKYQPQHYILRDNGYAMEKEAFQITVANASQFGNNAYIAPDADITDGLLDVTVISPFPKFFAPSIGLKLFNMKLGKSKFVEMFRVKRLEVEREAADYVHFDGEPMLMGKKILFDIKPLGLKLYVP